MLVHTLGSEEAKLSDISGSAEWRASTSMKTFSRGQSVEAKRLFSQQERRISMKVGSEEVLLGNSCRGTEGARKWGWSLCTSNKLPGDTDVAGLETTLGVMKI